MTDGEVRARAGRGRRVRSFVANRSATQRLGAVAAVLVVLSAPFGGWRSASDREVERLALDQRLDLGPFHVTITRVQQVEELPPVLEDDPTSRFLVIRAEVTNHTDRPEFADLVSDAIGGEDVGVLAWEDQQLIEPRVFGIDDAVEVPRGEFVNPGQTYHYAFVFRQRPDTDLDDVVLAITGYHFQEVDPHTLDPDRWVPDDTPLARGHLPIEVEE